MGEVLRAAFAYGRRRLGPWRLRGAGPERQRHGFDASDLRGYPSNHGLLAAGGVVVPSWQLYRRWRRLVVCYPKPLISLLDVGCCRGWFVLEAARRASCERALGIDVHVPFVEVAQRLAAYVGASRARFETASLVDLCDEPGRFGAPFQTVLLINTYHYLYWGSPLSPVRFDGHAEIVDALALLAADRVVFSSPLELRDCPGAVRRAAAREPARADHYCHEAFLAAVTQRFDVEPHGMLSRRRPLLVLHHRDVPHLVNF